MAVAGLGGISAEQPVPPGQIKAEVAVGFRRVDGVMDPVHVRRHDEEAQDPVEAAGKLHVGMVEHGGRVQKHFEDQHRDSGRAEHGDDGQFDPHGQEDFHRVEAQAGGHVDFQIRMMHPVQPPQGRHGMKHDMLQVDRQVEGRYGDENGQPGRDVEDIK